MGALEETAEGEARRLPEFHYLIAQCFAWHNPLAEVPTGPRGATCWRNVGRSHGKEVGQYLVARWSSGRQRCRAQREKSKRSAASRQSLCSGTPCPSPPLTPSSSVLPWRRLRKARREDCQNSIISSRSASLG